MVANRWARHLEKDRVSPPFNASRNAVSISLWLMSRDLDRHSERTRGEFDLSKRLRAARLG